jgi:hypothetical protein
MQGGGDQATKQWVPATSLRKTLQWSSLRAVSFLRHGSGTSIFSALLNDVSVVIKAPRYGISEEETRTVTAELLHEVSRVHSPARPPIARLKPGASASSRLLLLLLLLPYCSVHPPLLLKIRPSFWRFLSTRTSLRTLGLAQCP